VRRPCPRPCGNLRGGTGGQNPLSERSERRETGKSERSAYFIVGASLAFSIFSSLASLAPGNWQRSPRERLHLSISVELCPADGRVAPLNYQNTYVYIIIMPYAENSGKLSCISGVGWGPAFASPNPEPLRCGRTGPRSNDSDDPWRPTYTSATCGLGWSAFQYWFSDEFAGNCAGIKTPPPGGVLISRIWARTPTGFLIKIPQGAEALRGLVHRPDAFAHAPRSANVVFTSPRLPGSP